MGLTLLLQRLYALDMCRKYGDICHIDLTVTIKIAFELFRLGLVLLAEHTLLIFRTEHAEDAVVVVPYERHRVVPTRPVLVVGLEPGGVALAVADSNVTPLRQALTPHDYIALLRDEIRRVRDTLIQLVTGLIGEIGVDLVGTHADELLAADYLDAVIIGKVEALHAVVPVVVNALADSG